MERLDVIVIGAGAAGMMCASAAGKRGRAVLVLDHAETPGEKIRISGGGRCNFTNRNSTPAQFISGNPRFCISALSRYTQHEFVALVEQYGIAYHEKKLGQLFCDGSARQIIDLLLSEMKHAKAELRLNSSVTHVDKTPEGFTLHLSSGEELACRALVVASGGKSVPKMGASDFGYRIAAQFGLAVTPTRPALVPLTFEGALLERAKALTGIALEARVRCGKTEFAEAVLFTHRGLSGPAILQISSYWRQGGTIVLDLLPDRDAETLLKERKRARPKAEPKTILGEFFPARLAQALAASLPDATMANIPDRALSTFAARLKRFEVTPAGSEGYAKAEVTVGGIDTRDLSSKTMQARDVSGLYVIGEAVDVTGWLGGYNFQWAWSSGWCAGQIV